MAKSIDELTVYVKGEAITASKYIEFAGDNKAFAIIGKDLYIHRGERVYEFLTNDFMKEEGGK